MGSRKVRKNEAARRDQRAPVSEKTRRTLRDLPDYSEQQDERATNPVIRLTQRVTALPPPLPVEDEEPDQSLEMLALLARRSSPPPRAPVVHRLLAPVAPIAASAATVVPPVAAAGTTQSSIPAMTVGSSSAPPARSNTSPPRRRASDHGPRRGGLGTVALSATVGAIVALGMWSLRNGLDRVARDNDPTRPVSTLAAAAALPADKCASSASPPVSPAAAAPPVSSTVLAASTAESEPRPVSIDTLPVQSFGATPARATRTTTSRRSTAATTSRTSLTASDAPQPRPVVQRAPVSPRAAVTDAVQRASFAARSCESGPQSGKVEVTFSPTGAVSSVSLIKGFDDAGVNGCVLRAFGRVRIGAFEGDPISVRKTVSW